MSDETKKLIIATALTVVVTAAVSGVITWVVTTSSAGVDAAEKARIEGVVAGKLRLPDGRSHSQVLIDLDKEGALREQKIELMVQSLRELAEDVDDIQ